MRRTRLIRLGLLPARCLAAGKVSSPKLKHSDYDIVVVGGGMVGAAFACALAVHPVGRGLRVAVLEAAPPKKLDQLPEAPHIRVSALSLATVKLLKDVGAWPLMEKARVTPYNEMQVWHTAGRGRVHWRAQDMGVSELGFIVENDVTQGALFQRLQQLASEDGCNFEVVAPVKIEAISRDGPEGVPVLTLEGGQQVSAQLLVGADGQQSQVKRFAGFDQIGIDYNHRGVVASVRVSEPHSTAWQRFLPTGPVALLPCHGQYSSIVWSTTPEHAQHLCTIPEEQFLEDLNNAFHAPPDMFRPGGRPPEHLLPNSFYQMLPILFPDPPRPAPPKIEAVCTPRMFFPLRLVHVMNYTKPHIALIGDAAHAIHPMAGQGLNLGIGDARELAETLLEAIQLGISVGDPTPLKSYEQKRQAANLQMQGGVHAIKTLFTPNEGLLAMARCMGLDLFNATPLIKNTAAAYAMGIDPGYVTRDNRPAYVGATPWEEPQQQTAMQQQQASTEAPAQAATATA